MAAPSGEFEMARRVAVRMMETRAFAKDIEEEDPTMVKYIPPLRRLNELGMITFDSQSGRRFTFPHYQTGKIIKMSERAYCKGFVDASVAAAVVQWMWDNTDKYVARAIDIEGVSRGDKAIYTVLEEFGQLGVVQKECEGSVSWPAQASPVVMSHDLHVALRPVDLPGEARQASRCRRRGGHKARRAVHGAPHPRGRRCVFCAWTCDSAAGPTRGTGCSRSSRRRSARRKRSKGPKRPKSPK
jgi:hypothetical protein